MTKKNKHLAKQSTLFNICSAYKSNRNLSQLKSMLSTTLLLLVSRVIIVLHSIKCILEQ